MSDTIASLLLPAIGITMSPVPMTVLLFILLNSKTMRNSFAFLAGWIVSLFIVMFAVVFVADARQFFTSYYEITPFIHMVSLVTGVLLIIFAAYQWLRRPRKSQPMKPPKWVKAMGVPTPFKSFGVACIMAGFSPKNGILAIASAIVISGVSVSMSESFALTLTFIIVASLIIFIPIVCFLLAPRTAKKMSHIVEKYVYHSTAGMVLALFALGITLIVYALFHW